ncbi:hypothetical protein [Pedobacter sp. SYSU D00535]|uniref:hypothetical protein n=1 Tax=Pedobacter sp. SYSU D00535 TaxID=2810308 RepID=UPI001A9780B9|nr:hypothetical protein [Pedobacter sp. SYSU D00535]
MGQLFRVQTVFLLLLQFIALKLVAQSEIKQVSYQWKSVNITGGGFVSGIVFHPKEDGLRYCRTDMGGAYRWNASSKSWEALLDWLSYEDRNLMGVESIALDPNDPDRVYLACGTYTTMQPNAILISTNRGKSFKRVNVPIRFGANENGRGNGEKLAVDPANSDIIYLGTRLDGLWRSEDRGLNWKKIESFPDIAESPPTNLSEAQRRRWRWQNQGSGIVFVAFASENKSSAGSKVLYAGTSLKDRTNLYKSTDGGQSWTPVIGQPTRNRITSGVLGADGNLYITYGSNPGPGPMVDGEVWKLNTHTGRWMEITPDKPEPEKNRAFGYAAIALDCLHPQNLLVSSYNRYQAGGEELFRSVDGGQTWTAILRKSEFDNSLAPYVKTTGVHWLFDIEIDPHNSDHAIFTTGYGGHETFNLSAADQAKPVTWTVMSKGIEETVALELQSPPTGAALLSAIGDYGGFVHWDLDKPSPEGNFQNPHFGNTNGIAYAEKRPEVIVRVGAASHQVAGSNIGYSMDGGKTWKPAKMPGKDSKYGHIAVSADGNTWIWTPQNSHSYCTQNAGKSWKQVHGLPKGIRIVADKFSGRRFYGIDLMGGKFYVSKNSGSSFTSRPLPATVKLPLSKAMRGDPRGGQDRIYTSPAAEGDLWIAAFDGLYQSMDSGESFKQLKLVEEIHAFGFGKGRRGAVKPTLYLVGKVAGTRGIFRSEDYGNSWERINDGEHQWGLVLHITGDPKVFGRVYVGTHGRGIFYGDPKKTERL